ncbi:MAG: hypothetical protein AAFY26_26395 [Cyanobacteria bacterium J06638_22]
MAQASKLATWAGGATLVLSAIALLQQPAPAQDAADPGLENREAGSRENFSGGQTINSPLDLIHQSNFSNDRSAQEIEEDRRNNIRNAADDFLLQRQQRLQETNAAPEPTPSSTMQTP